MNSLACTFSRRLVTFAVVPSALPPRNDHDIKWTTSACNDTLKAYDTCASLRKLRNTNLGVDIFVGTVWTWGWLRYCSFSAEPHPSSEGKEKKLSIMQKKKEQSAKFVLERGTDGISRKLLSLSQNNIAARR